MYERGLAYCGQEYNSSSLWDKYIKFEEEQGSALHIVSLFTRVLACPTKELEKYYKRYARTGWHPRARAGSACAPAGCWHICRQTLTAGTGRWCSG